MSSINLHVSVALRLQSDCVGLQFRLSQHPRHPFLEYRRYHHYRFGQLHAVQVIRHSFKMSFDPRAATSGTLNLTPTTSYSLLTGHVSLGNPTVSIKASFYTGSADLVFNRNQGYTPLNPRPARAVAKASRSATPMASIKGGSSTMRQSKAPASRLTARPLASQTSPPLPPLTLLPAA